MADNFAKNGFVRRNQILSLLIYPLTVIEVLVMLAIWALQSIALRLYYASWWYPERLRKTTKYVNWAASMDSHAALEAMITLDGLAAETGVRSCWISGTLLGLERQNRPLDFDHDMDMGLFGDDNNLNEFLKRVAEVSVGGVPPTPKRLTAKCLIQNPDIEGLIDRVARYKGQIRDMSGQGRPATNLDFFLHFPYAGGHIHLSRNSMWWNSNMTTATRRFGDNDFSVPADTHLYLRENYGDYKTESREFENSIDCPNALSIFSWVSFVYLLRRKTMLVKLAKHDKVKKINGRILQTILKGLTPLSNGKRPSKISS